MMPAIVEQLDSNDEVFQEIGEIIEVVDDGFVIEHKNSRFRASKAASCLVEPDVGDEVLFAGRRSGKLFVLAIFERPEGTATRIAPSGDLDLSLNGGRLAVAVAHGVDLFTSGDLRASSSGLSFRATEASLFFDTLTYLGRKALAEVDGIKTIAGALDSVLERFSRRVKRSYRFVEEVDQVRSSQIDYSASKNLRLRGDNALVSAEHLVKVNGDQIHLG